MRLHAYDPRPAHLKWLLDSDPAFEETGLFPARLLLNLHEYWMEVMVSAEGIEPSTYCLQSAKCLCFSGFSISKSGKNGQF
jgi:hypothetical protein